MPHISRRRALFSIASALAGAGLASCARRRPDNADSVVVYTSADDVIARPLLAVFERQTGLTVRMKGDTEATKTTGLVERLRAEHQSGRAGADVFWSSEPFLTAMLAAEGVLAVLPQDLLPTMDPPPSGSARGEGDGQPRWIGFARRARMVVYHTRRFATADEPALTDIMSDSFCAAAPAIARPQFGTTRGHFAAILAWAGEDEFIRWLRRLKKGGARLVDGNSAAVRAVAQGECSLGLTDTDDVWSGRREGWPVAGRPACHRRTDARAEHWGPMYLPNAAGVVAGGPNPVGAAMLVRFLVSEQSERWLMESESHNMPVRPALMDQMRRDLAPFVVEGAEDSALGPSMRDVMGAMARSQAIVAAELG